MAPPSDWLPLSSYLHVHRLFLFIAGFTFCLLNLENYLLFWLSRFCQFLITAVFPMNDIDSNFTLFKVVSYHLFDSLFRFILYITHKLSKVLPVFDSLQWAAPSNRLLVGTRKSKYISDGAWVNQNYETRCVGSQGHQQKSMFMHWRTDLASSFSKHCFFSQWANNINRTWISNFSISIKTLEIYELDMWNVELWISE